MGDLGIGTLEQEIIKAVLEDDFDVIELSLKADLPPIKILKLVQEMLENGYFKEVS